jgi:hypothetical protein
MSWKECGKEGPNLRHYSGICFEGLRKTMKASVRIASLWADIGMRDLPNMKHAFCLLHRETRKLISRNGPSTFDYTPSSALANLKKWPYLVGQPCTRRLHLDAIRNHNVHFNSTPWAHLSVLRAKYLHKYPTVRCEFLDYGAV